jgi:photosystem II stability/assembly factor-like uncharacterized protein
MRFHALAALLLIGPLAGCTVEKLIGADQLDCDPGAVEACDGIDNDCDGAIDEDVPGVGIACETGISGSCADGQMACTAAHMRCEPVAGDPEICDGVDNDCDGEIDEEGGWESFDEGLNGGTVGDVAFDPRSPTQAYALVGNRIHRSEDGGKTFAEVGRASHTLRKLAFPPDEPNALLAASEDGLMYSPDSGASWQNLAFDGVVLMSVFIHPADPAWIYVGTQEAGIFRSTNGGISFQPKNVGVPLSRVNDFAGDPSDPDSVNATLFVIDDQGGFSGGQILHSDNGGDSWTAALDGVGRVLGLHRCEADASRLYAGIWGEGVATSSDGGTSWSLVGLNGVAVQDIVSSADDCDVVYASAFPEGVYRSTNGGAFFDGPVDAGMNVQIPGQVWLTVDPSDDGRVLGGNHSGVFLNEDWSVGWTRVSTIGAVNVTDIAAGVPDSPLWLSSYGQGLWQRADAAATWTQLSSQALPRDWVFTVAPDPFDTSRIFAGTLSDLWLSTDGGASFSMTPVDVSVFDVAFDPVDGDKVFAATQTAGVFVTLDGGSSWTTANTGLPDPWQTGPCLCQDIRQIVVDPDDATRVYLGTNGKGIHRSLDGGVTWQPSDTQLADEAIGCLIPHDGALYACVDGAGIWRSDDGATFTQLTTGLAELNNVRGLVVDEATGRLYATSDAGVFHSDDDGAAWEGLANTCLPTTDLGAPVIVTDGSDRRIAFPTAGAGVLSSRLP